MCSYACFLQSFMKRGYEGPETHPGFLYYIFLSAFIFFDTTKWP